MIKNEKIDFNKSNEDGETPFYIACKNDHSEVIEIMMKNEKIDFNKCDEHDLTPFGITCGQNTMCSASVYF